MNTGQLLIRLVKDGYTRSMLGGVLAADRLPQHVIQRPAMYVVNTINSDDYDKIGHWVVFYFGSDGCGEFWDSCGQTPLAYGVHFNDFLRVNCTMYTFNVVAVQPAGTLTCGLYCLLYCYHRARGRSLNSINEYFNNDTLNDTIVYNFVKAHMPG